MTDRYAVIGNPIAHSKSPLIHAAFARQTGQDLTYGRILGHPDGFAGEVRRFFADGGRGLNVTVPFKEQAWALVDERSPRAETAGAVNTLIPLPDGRLRGDNTDGVGLVRDLAVNHGFVGAGGASRGVLRPLLETGLRELVIANRTAVQGPGPGRNRRRAGTGAGEWSRRPWGHCKRRIRSHR
jgi:shikimate dehydrogenase